MKLKTHLLIIDAQNDFVTKTGSLYVDGADVGVQKAAHFVNKEGGKLDDISMTMDSHHLWHIAHPCYWRNQHGDRPKPFTQISHQDLLNKVWVTTDPALQADAEYYTQTLEATGKYTHTIWPPHCLIGGSGSNVETSLFQALLKWEDRYCGMVNKVSKGSNYKREHFSGLKAEVEDTDDVSTSLNTSLIQMIADYDRILVFGWALSHCLKSTVEDIANNFPDEYIKKLILLRDCTSSVAGFEAQGENFIKEMTARGMQVDYSDRIKL